MLSVCATRCCTPAQGDRPTHARPAASRSTMSASEDAKASSSQNSTPTFSRHAFVVVIVPAFYRRRNSSVIRTSHLRTVLVTGASIPLTGGLISFWPKINQPKTNCRSFWMKSKRSLMVVPRSGKRVHSLAVSAQQTLLEMLGPSGKEQWLYWRSQTPAQANRRAVITELEKLLSAPQVTPLLSHPNNPPSHSSSAGARRKCWFDHVHFVSFTNYAALVKWIRKK